MSTVASRRTWAQRRLLGVSPRVTKSGSPGLRPKIGSRAGKNARPRRRRMPLTIFSFVQPMSPGSGRPGDALTSHRPPRKCRTLLDSAPNTKNDLFCAATRDLSRPHRRTYDEISRSGGGPHAEVLYPRHWTKYPVQGDPLTPFVAPGNEISCSGRPPPPPTFYRAQVTKYPVRGRGVHCRLLPGARGSKGPIAG